MTDYINETISKYVYVDVVGTWINTNMTFQKIVRQNNNNNNNDNNDNNDNMAHSPVSGKIVAIKTVTHHQHINSDISIESILTD